MTGRGIWAECVAAGEWFCKNVDVWGPAFAGVTVLKWLARGLGWEGGLATSARMTILRAGAWDPWMAGSSPAREWGGCFVGWR